jgi:glutamine amidotransferase
MRVTVIDYKAGNLTSVLKALRHLGAEVEVTDADLAPIASAERIVLPGVGHFAATQYLDSTGIAPAIRAAIVTRCSLPWHLRGHAMALLGIDRSAESAGLGHFPEQCARFSESHEKVPHVGWNSLEVKAGSRLLAGVEPGEFVYFTHSYKAPVTRRHRGRNALHRAFRVRG